MTIGIVTVTYNSSSVIDGFMRSVLRQSHADFVLYVIDNSSSDDTVQQLGGYSDARVRVILNGHNYGFAGASNQGIRAALADGCESVLLLNNDTEFEPELLQTLALGMHHHACDMVAPKILYFDRPSTIWSAGGEFDSRKAYAGVHYGLNQTDHGQCDVAKTVEHAPACCLLVKRKVFERVGLFDENFFTYLEDMDFCYRAKLADLTLVYLPSAAVLHKAHALTGGDSSPFSMKYITRNRVYFLFKHFGIRAALLYVPAYQGYLIVQLLAGKLSFSLFRLRERALLEGFRLWRRAKVVA